MTRLFVKLAMVAIVAFSSSPTLAQMLPPRYAPNKAEILAPAKKAEHVKIIQGPVLELAHDDLAIVRWTTTNPGGTDEHFGIVHYGTDPSDLSQTAKTDTTLNRAHPETIFRVRMPGLEPETTYYYWVSSIEADGTDDGVKSTVSHFTTPAPGKRIIAFPQPGSGG
jgi:Purple acid Phosphatase, N-terminal domain